MDAQSDRDMQADIQTEQIRGRQVNRVTGRQADIETKIPADKQTDT